MLHKILLPVQIRDIHHIKDVYKRQVMIMCLIHDIVEIDAGDTYAYDTEGLKTQKAREDAAKERIFSCLLYTSSS